MTRGWASGKHKWIMSCMCLAAILALSCQGCKRKTKTRPKTQTSVSESVPSSTESGGALIVDQKVATLSSSEDTDVSVGPLSVFIPAKSFSVNTTAHVSLMTLDNAIFDELAEDIEIRGHCGQLIVRDSDDNIVDRDSMYHPVMVQLPVPESVAEEDLYFVVFRDPDLESEVRFSVDLIAMSRVTIEGVEHARIPLIESNARFCFIESQATEQIAAGFTPYAESEESLWTSSFTPSVDAIITNARSIRIIFKKQVLSNSLVIGGSLASYADHTWSTTTSINDTLTVSPDTSWPVGVQSITVAVHDASAFTSTTLNRTFTVEAAHLLFVTSTQYTALQIASVTHADELCNGRAEAGNLGVGFKAVISGTFPDHADQRVSIWQPVKNMIGQQVAADLAEFWGTDFPTPEFSAGVGYNEYGAVLETEVWTATTPYGMGGGNNCSNWTSNSGTALYGNSAFRNNKWVTASGVEGNCSTTRSLYCLSQ